MRGRLPGWLGKMVPGKGALLPLVAIAAMAALAAAVAIRVRHEGASGGDQIGPSNGTPAIPLPHRGGPPPAAGV
jgi:hypothetical protein